MLDYGRIFLKLDTFSELESQCLLFHRKVVGSGDTLKGNSVAECSNFRCGNAKTLNTEHLSDLKDNSKQLYRVDMPFRLW